MKILRNSVHLIGNLGRDVEFKELANGNKMAKFSLATNEFYKNNKGEQIQNTTWHNIIAWGSTAELMKKVLSKGNEVAIQGKLINSNYEDKNGNTVYKTEIRANEFINLSKKKELELQE